MEQEFSRYAVSPGVGQTSFSPEQLSLVSEIAGPGGRVELNPFMQLIIHTFSPEVAAQHARLKEAGLSVYPIGPVVKNLHTCSFCSGENAAGLPDALALDEAVAGTPVPFPVRVGFSGCSANCAEALVRDIGVVRMDNGVYDIFLGGRPGSLTPGFGVKVAEGVMSEQLVPVVGALLGTYRETAKGKERLWKNVARVGPEAYVAAAEGAR